MVKRTVVQPLFKRPSGRGGRTRTGVVRSFFLLHATFKKQKKIRLGLGVFDSCLNLLTVICYYRDYY